MCLLQKPSLQSNRWQTAIGSLCWYVCVYEKQRLDRCGACICKQKHKKTKNSDWIGWLVYTNIIAMWLVSTDDSVFIVCIVASIKLDLSILCWLLPKMAGSLL